jgi:chemotaxis protein histidine kinase CheA
MSATDISGYSELFFKTADEHIERVEEGLKEVMKAVNPKEVTEEIYRHIHSLKGSSSVMGYNTISDLCSKIDELMHPEEDIYTITDHNIDELMSLVGTLKKDLLEMRTK